MGSHSNPRYILRNVLEKEVYDTLEGMLQARVSDLLPRGANDLTAAASYYRSLGELYRQRGWVYCLQGGCGMCMERQALRVGDATALRI